MKNKLTLVLLLIGFTTVLSSCDEADELTKVDVKSDFVATLDVSVTQGLSKESAASKAIAPTSYDWSSTATIDLSSNSDLQNNLDKIEKIVINSLSYEIINYSSDASISMSDSSIDIGGTLITLDDANLEDADDNNTIFTIDDAAKLAAIVNALKTDNSVTITGSGKVDGAPVLFGIKITMDTTITIDVI